MTDDVALQKYRHFMYTVKGRSLKWNIHTILHSSLLDNKVLQRCVFDGIMLSI
jgi:hypothetical protein